MKHKILTILLSALIATMLLSGCSSSQSTAPSPAQKNEAAQHQSAPQASNTSKMAMDYFTNLSDDKNVITPKSLFAKMDAKENMLIVDIRRADDYEKGHLIGAINIPYGKAIAENLEILPNDKPLVIYCYTGQTSSQTVVLLTMAGKNAKTVQSGFNRGILATDDFAKYVNTEKVALPTQTYKVDGEAKAAVVKYFSGVTSLAGSKMAALNIDPGEVKAIIDSKDKSYYILSVRASNDYKAGDLPTALNIPFGKGMEKNFSSLPKDKKIIVSCYTGQTASQTIAVLRLLGYEAYNMNGGMGKADNPKFGWLGEAYATAAEKTQNADKPAAKAANAKV